jgi:DNA-binding FadR family transcriptional regulator
MSIIAWKEPDPSEAGAAIAGMDWRIRPGALNEAARIYESVTGERGDFTRRAANVAWRIENSLVLNGWPTHATLGSEAVLAEAFAVSREVIREAIRIGEGRGSLGMRRGRSGGLMACQPSRARVSWALAEYLFCSGATLDQLREACAALDPLVLADAARQAPPWRDVNGDDDDVYVEGIDRAGRRIAFRQAVGAELADPVLALFWDIATQLGVWLSSAREPEPEDAGENPLRYERWLGEAIRRGDAGSAARLAARQVRECWPFAFPLSGGSGFAGTADPRFAPAEGVGFARASPIARQLAAEIRERGSGARLGSEWDLCSRFGVGRPILRQALRMLEDFGVIESRRGRTGGVICCAPKRGAIVRFAFPYIAASGTSGGNLLDLVWHLNLATLRAAGARAQSFSVEERSRHLDRLHARLAARHGADQWMAIPQTISDICGNDVLHLMLRILVGFAARMSAPKALTTAEGRTLIERGVHAVEALLAGDVARAEEIQRGCQEFIDRKAQLALA